MKNTLGGINSRPGDTEESISDLKARIMKSSIRTAKRKTNLKNNVSLMGLWDNIKYINIYIIGVWRGENKENGVENTFDEIMTETSWNRRRKQLFRYRKHRQFQTRWTQTDPHQDISSKGNKCKKRGEGGTWLNLKALHSKRNHQQNEKTTYWK